MFTKKYSNGFDFHNSAHKRLYMIWFDMKRRCYQSQNKRYDRYGARGIAVCEEWKDDFQSFFDWSMRNGYDETLSIDRIDMNGDYTPTNCRWVDKYIQANNRSNNHFITHNGKTQTLMQWSKEVNMNYSTLRQRVRSGWSFDDVINRPIGRWL